MPSPSPLDTAVSAAHLAGDLLRQNYETELAVGELTRHDIKLDLDVRSQQVITDALLGAFPGDEIFGEEGRAGTPGAERQWIVDPIDGTVNYFYGIPHFCVSIALRERGELILGVIYDPMANELFTVEKDGPPLRNGRVISVSRRARLADAVVTVGFSKTTESIQKGGERFIRLDSSVWPTRCARSASLAAPRWPWRMSRAVASTPTSRKPSASGTLRLESSSSNAPEGGST
jgi:myo-inositol-1(or 4)-monophosphatase